MFMEQPVAVIGGGDAALDEALYLTQYASQVTIVHRRDALRACRLLQERAQANPEAHVPLEYGGASHRRGGVVQRLQVEDVKTGERSALDVAGVFPYLGLTPNTPVSQWPRTA